MGGTEAALLARSSRAPGFSNVRLKLKFLIVEPKSSKQAGSAG
jgi:hypothetical protein